MSSAAVDLPSLCFSIEYLDIVLRISCASVGLSDASEGSMLSPEQDVRILVFCGFKKHPLDLPNFSISVQKTLMSSWCTVDEMSSM